MLHTGDAVNEFLLEFLTLTTNPSPALSAVPGMGRFPPGRSLVLKSM